MKLIRKTKSVCPECIKKIDAEIVEEEGKVYMLKECPNHGKFKVLLFDDAKYYQELHTLYSSLNSLNTKKSDFEFYSLFLTMRCNLNCPICFVNANKNSKGYAEPSLDFIRNMVAGLKNTRIGLFGGEPTMREDLPEIIKIIKKSGNFSDIATNGIKLTDHNYLKKLKDSGLGEVHLQFDGFNDGTYETFRRRKLLKIKKQALENLKDLKIPTIFEVTVGKGVNDNEMEEILNFAIRNNFVRCVTFNSYMVAGKAKTSKLGIERRPPLDFLIKILEKQTNGKISKRDVSDFQKLSYLANSLLSQKSCFNHQYLLLIRKRNGFKTINQELNIPNFQEVLEKHLRLKKENKKVLSSLVILQMLPKLLKVKDFHLLLDLIFIFLRAATSNKPITFKSIPRNMLLLGFLGPCDAYTFDEKNIGLCMTGDIKTNTGLLPAILNHISS